jgi:hypothetical protein
MPDLTPGMGLAGYSLSFTLLLELMRKGVLTSAEAAETVERALLAIETHQTETDPADREQFECARALLEELRLGVPFRT